MLHFTVHPASNRQESDCGRFSLVCRKECAEGAIEEKVTRMTKDAKEIAKVLVKEFRKLARDGELDRDGKKVAAAINNLREERRLTPRELNRRATI